MGEPLRLPMALPQRLPSRALYRLPDGRPAAGAAPDETGAPSWWSRQTLGRRVRATTMREALDRASADAESLGGVRHV